MARRLKRGIKAALDYLDEAYARGVVIVYRGPELLFSGDSRLHRDTLKAVIRKSERLRPDLIEAFSHRNVFVQQEARAEARDWGIPYDEAVEMVDNDLAGKERACLSACTVEQCGMKIA
jgi:hypothetical protein